MLLGVLEGVIDDVWVKDRVPELVRDGLVLWLGDAVKEGVIVRDGVAVWDPVALRDAEPDEDDEPDREGVPE